MMMTKRIKGDGILMTYQNTLVHLTSIFRIQTQR